jgi:hypothetical protein
MSENKSTSAKIDRLDPSTVKVGWEGTLTIYGSNFGEAKGFVLIEAREPKTSSWSTSKIAVDITKDITETAGKKRLVVHGNNGEFDETQWSVEEQPAQSYKE